MPDVFSFEDFLNGKPMPNKRLIFDEDDEVVEPKVEEKVIPQELIKESLEKEEEEKEEEEEEEEEIEKVGNEEEYSKNDSNDEYYKLYQDKNEEFSCEITIEGCDPNETTARLVLETSDWNLIFNGEIRNGKCFIPVRKLNILKEGEIGNIKLEVVAEGNLFIPWEDKFKVKVSKKVTVKMNESKQQPKKQQPNNKIGVKVKF
jgi:hypothetical protein